MQRRLAGAATKYSTIWTHYDLEDYASNIYFNGTKVFSLEHLTELIVEFNNSKQ